MSGRQAPAVSAGELRTHGRPVGSAQIPEVVLAIPQLLLFAGLHFGIAVGGIVSVNHR